MTDGGRTGHQDRDGRADHPADLADRLRTALESRAAAVTRGDLRPVGVLPSAAGRGRRLPVPREAVLAFLGVTAALLVCACLLLIPRPDHRAEPARPPEPSTSGQLVPLPIPSTDRPAPSAAPR